MLKLAIKKEKEQDTGGGERRGVAYRERVNMRERERNAESEVGVCLLTKSLKSMAVLMNISQRKLVPSSAGTDSLAD